jgi:hypothetical protein
MVKQRGRQSAKANGLPREGKGSRALSPPDSLSDAEAALFYEVTANVPRGQFSVSDVYLLSTFVQVTSLIRTLAQDAAKADQQTRQVKTKMLLEASKTQLQLATKPRLTTQSRTTAEKVGRAQAKHRPSFYDQFLPEGDEWKS